MFHIVQAVSFGERIGRGGGRARRILGRGGVGKDLGAEEGKGVCEKVIIAITRMLSRKTNRHV